MNRCLITYENCGTARYSVKGLQRLSPRLGNLREFPYSSAEQRREALLRADKISIQGVQPKLSARLSIADEEFKLVDRGGRYILKPQHADFPELPENEDLSMRLAAMVGIETPLHGLLLSVDKSLTYFIKRFDRKGQKDKLAVQDFATLAGKNRETKYQFSIEHLLGLLRHCSFPVIETVEMYRRLLFNFLIGNEDMHLKNWALLTFDNKIALAPAYDYLNTTVAYRVIGKPFKEIEETALPLAGKKKNLSDRDWISYLARQRLKLNNTIIDRILSGFATALPNWKVLIDRSFLSDPLKELYQEVIEVRSRALGI